MLTPERMREIADELDNSGVPLSMAAGWVNRDNSDLSETLMERARTLLDISLELRTASYEAERS